MVVDRIVVVQALRALHIAAGSIALVSLWFPLFARKGGRLHRRAGWIYCGAMGVIVVSAVAICAERLLFEPPSTYPSAVFLAFISLLAFTNLLTGLRVLRRKDRVAPSRSVVELLPPLLLAASALGVIAAGLVWRQPLLVVFPVVGLATAYGQLSYWLRAPGEKMHWWFTHLGQMGGACIATVTAFFVVNASHLGLGTGSFVLWFTPGIVGSALIVGATRHYQRRFAPRPHGA